MKLKAFVVGILVVGVYPFIAHWISPDSQSGSIHAARVQMNYFSELKTLADVLKLVQAKFVEEELAKDKEKLIQGGIEGILRNWMTHLVDICHRLASKLCKKKLMENLED